MKKSNIIVYFSAFKTSFLKLFLYLALVFFSVHIAKADVLGEYIVANGVTGNWNTPATWLKVEIVGGIQKRVAALEIPPPTVTRISIYGVVIVPIGITAPTYHDAYITVAGAGRLTVDGEITFGQNSTLLLAPGSGILEANGTVNSYGLVKPTKHVLGINTIAGIGNLNIYNIFVPAGGGEIGGEVKINIKNTGIFKSGAPIYMKSKTTIDLFKYNNLLIKF